MPPYNIEERLGPALNRTTNPNRLAATRTTPTSGHQNGQFRPDPASLDRAICSSVGHSAQTFPVASERQPSLTSWSVAADPWLLAASHRRNLVRHWLVSPVRAFTLERLFTFVANYWCERSWRTMNTTSSSVASTTDSEMNEIGERAGMYLHRACRPPFRRARRHGNHTCDLAGCDRGPGGCLARAASPLWGKERSSRRSQDNPSPWARRMMPGRRLGLGE